MRDFVALSGQYISNRIHDCHNQISQAWRFLFVFIYFTTRHLQIQLQREVSVYCDACCEDDETEGATFLSIISP